MNLVRGTARVITEAGEAATAVVGAVGGAAVGSVGGGIKGVVEGAYDGAQYGRHSTPAALATIGAAGTVGVVWPVALAAGGTALVLRLVRPQPEAATKPTTTSRDRQTASSRRASSNRSSSASAQRHP
ncbi:hypothetical protein ACFYVR_18575 [Rhodococcus sp. NPDC003318]|uniref:hypothetical protein n=1 Tax=Rhodococcus sp. NPDC003318 TaxID=3364503 RepID=UPI003677D564